MRIIPTAVSGTYRTGSVRGASVGEITRALGFAPNQVEDDDKVRYSWGAQVEGGKRLAVWDYKGSAARGQFSTYGPHSVFLALFGPRYTAESEYL